MKRITLANILFVLTALFTISSFIVANKYENPLLFMCFLIGAFLTMLFISYFQRKADIAKELADFDTNLTEDQIFFLDVIEEHNS